MCKWAVMIRAFGAHCQEETYAVQLTSSARSSSVIGNVSPSDIVVLILNYQLGLVDCTTGRLLGLDLFGRRTASAASASQ